MIFIWLLLTQTILSTCSSGCLRCDGSNNCLICDGSQLYVNVNKTCVKQTLQFCLFSQQINTCSVCAEGYYVEQNGKCATNPTGNNTIENCKFYSSYYRCKICQKNYYLSSDKRTCLKTTSKIAYCQVYSGEDTCAQCSYGYLSTDGKYCDEPTTLYDNCALYTQ